jgi:hypothetical protein
MQITFKLFATLTDYLPPDARRDNLMQLEVAPDATIVQIIEPFGMPSKLVHLVLVNGRYIEPEKRLTTTLVFSFFVTVQSHYDASFAREMGCTEAEWLGWLPAAIGVHAWQRDGQSVCIVLNESNTSPASLCIRWSVGEPRVIALARIPRLLVQFDFQATDASARYCFMRRFDLYMQRGGG